MPVRWWGPCTGPCSCAAGAGCDCAICADHTPCCIRAKVSGLALSATWPWCADAEKLNATFDMPWLESPTGIGPFRGTSEGVGCEWGADITPYCDFTKALFRIEYWTTGGNVHYYPIFALSNDDGSKYVYWLDNAVLGGGWDRDCFGWDESPFTAEGQAPPDQGAGESLFDITGATAKVTAFERATNGRCGDWGLDCGDCSDNPLPWELGVDLGSGGWTDGTGYYGCDECNEHAQGIYYPNAGLQTPCSWEYTIATGCTYQGNPIDFVVGVQLYITHNPPPQAQTAYYKVWIHLTSLTSAAWQSATFYPELIGCLGPFASAPDGKLTLTKVHDNSGLFCDGTMPNTIKLWLPNQ